MANPTCAVDGCERGGMLRRGWCDLHYLRWRLKGDPGPAHLIFDPDRGCSVDGCDRKHEAKGLCKMHYKRVHGRTWGNGDRDRGIVILLCERCGCEFRGRGWEPVQRFCSKSCAFKKHDYESAQDARRAAKRRRRALLAGVATEPYTLDEVAERDGWRCGICGERVGKKFPAGHKRSATVDHIVPLIAGGDDLKVNLQLAHHSCNSKKKHTGPGQLRLVG